MKQDQAPREPYCLLFGLGFISALQGSLLWTLFEFQGLSFYPKEAHAHLMIFGFLTAFISGFLMTAVPRMTASQPALPSEINMAAICVIAQWIVNGLNLSNFSILVFVLQILVLVVFFVRRVNFSKLAVPEGFVFIPFAVLSAFLGPIAFVLSSFDLLPMSEALRWLLLWSGQAFVLNLVCGLGSRLIPALSRLPMGLPMILATQKPSFRRLGLWAVLLNLTFLFETLHWVQAGLLLRGLWIAVFAYRYFGISKSPSTPSILGKGLKAAVGFMCVGYVLAGFFPEQSLHYLHLVFIGGFALITFLVATRVVLAHGGQSTEVEITSPALAAVAVLFLISGLARTFLYPTSWQQGLLLGVFAFLFASSLWMLFFGRFIFARKHK